jgi:regulator of protease activity HflC (stomatin/prohibitin superfamily)
VIVAGIDLPFPGTEGEAVIVFREVPEPSEDDVKDDPIEMNVNTSLPKYLRPITRVQRLLIQLLDLQVKAAELSKEVESVKREVESVKRETAENAWLQIIESEMDRLPADSPLRILLDRSY